MAARVPSVEKKRNYKDSAEYINGTAPAVDQLAFAEDINDHNDTLKDHKEHIDVIYKADHDFIVDFDQALVNPRLKLTSPN